MSRAKVDDLQTVSFLVIGQHHKAIATPNFKVSLKADTAGNMQAEIYQTLGITPCG
jgi:hypothetical protein